MIVGRGDLRWVLGATTAALAGMAAYLAYAAFAPGGPRGGSTAGLTFANPIVLAGTTTGTLTIGTSVNTTFSGGVTGANDLVINASAGTLSFTVNPLNNAGTVTNSSTGAGAITIGATGGIGANVTQIIQASNTSALTISGPFAVNVGAGLLG